MIPYNGFILSMVLMLSQVFLSQAPDRNCQNMNLKVEVMPATDQGANISITVPGDASVKVYLMAADAVSPPKEIQLINGELRNVGRGTYEIIIQDRNKKYCTELRKVTVD